MDLKKEEKERPCPSCKKKIEISLYEMINKREAKCHHCSSKYKFKSSDVSALHARLKDLEKAQENTAKALGKVFSNADIEIKRK